MTTTRTIQIPSSAPVRHPRRTRRIVLISTATLVLLGGTYTALNLLGKSEHTSTASIPDVRELVVNIDSGDIRMVATAEQVVGLRTTTHRNLLGAPTAGYHLDNGVLTVTADCPPMSMNCSTDEEISVPAGVRVTVRDSTGSIDATDLDVPSWTAESSTGSIRASFVQPPGAIFAESSTGDITLRVPAGSYRVRAQTSTGDVSVGVVQDPSAARSINAETSTGDVTIVSR